MKREVRNALTRLGAWLPPRRIAQIQSLANHLAIGHALRDETIHRVLTRFAVFDAMMRCSHDGLLYLEFGVWKGETIRYWSDTICHPSARFVGFDSFEGLPQTGGFWDKGGFNVGGRLPAISDPRVSFVKGWFDQTLPDWTPPAHRQLIVSLDADLYDATVTVLQHLKPWLKPGTLLYCDELDQIEHEWRALRNSGLRLKPVAADHTLAHVAFEIVA